MAPRLTAEQTVHFEIGQGSHSPARGRKPPPAFPPAALTALPRTGAVVAAGLNSTDTFGASESAQCALVNDFANENATK